MSRTFEADGKKLDDGTPSRIFDNHENRKFSLMCTTVILGFLAMQVGAVDGGAAVLHSECFRLNMAPSLPATLFETNVG